MLKVIDEPVIIRAAGEPPKTIEEYFGRASSATEGVSIARMKSPAGWGEPFQRPDFDEYTVVLRGTLRVETWEGVLDIPAGRGILVGKGERVRYCTPFEGGAEYIAVCLPAFSPDTVHRED